MLVDVLYPICCGLDVHQATVVACLCRWQKGKVEETTRTFRTTVDGLTALRTWLEEAGCTHAAMEATGVYWKPVYNILAAEGSRLTVQVVNAQQIKALPGRDKTDCSDAAWIGNLLQHGLVKPSYIPSAAQRQLRDLTRTRTTLQNDRTAVINRLLKVLEDANIKLVGKNGVTDLMGVTGRLILQQLLAGVTDPAVLAELAKGTLRNKRAFLQEALAGRLDTHHRMMAALHLASIDFMDEQIAQVDQQIAEHTRPFARETALLDSIPGIGQRTAEILLAEIGSDMTHFRTAHHLASWTGMCPANHRSANKSTHGRRGKKGSPFVRRALANAATTAIRTKRPGETFFAERYRRMMPRMGHLKALVATGHALVRTVYAVLDSGTLYHPPQPPPLTPRQRRHLTTRALAALERAGYIVKLTDISTPAAA
jgi:transposase